MVAPPNAILLEGRRLSLSNLDKVLYPATGFTKGLVIDYYARIAPVMLPHIREHPLSLVRYPNGIGQPRFFQKNCPEHKPRWIRTTPLSREKETRLCMGDSQAALVWLANLAALELHPYLWTVAHPSQPALMVFDLDPGQVMTIIDCCRVGLLLHDLLGRLGLRSFAKTSGKKGLHLWVPLNTPTTFPETKAFALAVARILEEEDAAGITTTMTKSLRPRRIFIDWSQNDYHKTTVAAYSLRGNDRPTVSTPITWQEVRSAIRRGDPESLVFETADVLKRVARKGDVAAEALTLRQRLPHPG